MITASRMISQTAATRVEPSASRIPISGVRRATRKDITPYRPTTASGSAIVPRTLDTAASIRL
jgi:hypothetical protein